MLASMLLLGLMLVLETPDFVREVQPILSSRCYACHGPDAAAREGDLRLDERDEALRTAESNKTRTRIGITTA